MNANTNNQHEGESWFASPAYTYYLVVVLLLFAATLRIIGLSFGQPDPIYAPEDAPLNTINENTPLHPDEFLFIQRPLRMLLTGQLNPKFFHNPSFLINTNLAVFWLTGEQHRLSWDGREEIGARRAAPFRLYLTGRTFSVLGGVLAVAATYAVGRQLAREWGAMAAASLVTVSLPMVQHAHYTTTSSLASGFVMVCIWASFASLKRFRWWMFALASVAAGLAAGNRYNAAAVSLIVFFTGWILFFRQPKLNRFAWILLGWLLFPVIFLITTPHVIFDTTFFIEEFRFITNQYIGNDVSSLNVSQWMGLWYEYRYLIGYGIGIPATLIALLGFGYAWRQKQIYLILLLVYLVPYSYVVLRTIRPLGADQMLLPVIPVFALIAGMGFSAIVEKLPRKYRNPLALTLFLAVIIFPLVASVQVTSLFATQDTRYQVQQWVYENLPPGAIIHLDGPYNVPLDRTLYDWTQTYGGGNLPTVTDLKTQGVQYVIVSDAWYRHFERADYIQPDQIDAVKQHLAAYEGDLERLYKIDRPQIFGMNEAMHSATYWHHPGIVVYAIPETR